MIIWKCQVIATITVLFSDGLTTIFLASKSCIICGLLKLGISAGNLLQNFLRAMFLLFNDKHFPGCEKLKQSLVRNTAIDHEYLGTANYICIVIQQQLHSQNVKIHVLLKTQRFEGWKSCQKCCLAR